MVKFLNFVLYLLLLTVSGYAHASMHWQLATEKSRIDFTAKSTFHDFNGTAQKLSGSFEQNQDMVNGVVDVEIAGLTTDEPDRDKNMYQMFDIANSPKIHFVFKDTSIKDVLNRHDGEIRFNAVLTMHHVSQPITLVSTGHLEGNTLICEGQMHIHLKDYDLKAPSILGLIRVNDEVTVQYNMVFINQ